MLNSVILFSILIFLDWVMLFKMPRFYVKVGIPIYKSTIFPKCNKTTKDIQMSMGASGNFVYRENNDVVLYRSRLDYFSVRKIKGLCVVKGEVSIKNGSVNIVERMSISTLLFLAFIINLYLQCKIDVIGIILTVIVIVAVILCHLVKIYEIKKVSKDIENS